MRNLFPLFSPSVFKNPLKTISQTLPLLVAVSCSQTNSVPPTRPLTSTIPAASVVPTPTKSADNWTTTNLLQMRSARAAHTATTLPDGSVFIAGGFSAHDRALSSTERFVPSANDFISAAEMSEGRQSHSATMLPNGKLLIAGGFNGEYLASAELYDPLSDRFEPTGEMRNGRSGHIAVLLNNGKVLVAGGVGEGWTFLASAEIYDPDAGIFTLVDDMAFPRESHTATKLQNGRVLITGGHSGRRQNIVIYDNAELFDPQTNQFHTAGKMTINRHKHDALLLANGNVLITGGADERDAQGQYQSTELYDAGTGQFSAAAPMNFSRFKHNGTSILLPNGMGLILGGANQAELYDPAQDRFTLLPALRPSTRLFAAIALLENDAILFTGGYGAGVAVEDNAWLFSLSSS